MNNNLPPNWSWVKLGDVAEYINGRAFKPIEWEKQGLPIIRIQNLNDETANFNYSTKLFEKKYLVENGDLLFAWSASLGTYFWSRGKAWLNQHIFKVLPKDKISKRFLFYTLNFIVDQFYAKTHGSGMVHITKNKFEETAIPLPPLLEQKKIVEKIEELLSGLDSGVASLKKAKAQIRLYRQSVLASAFSGRLLTPGAECKAQNKMLKAVEPKIDYSNQLPDGWKWVNLGEIVESIRYGTSKKCYYEKEGKPVLRIPNIINGYINDEDLKYSKFNKDEIKELSLIENDILIIRSNGSLSIVGKSAIVSSKHKGFLYAGYLIRIRLIAESYSSKFLNLLLSSNQLRSQIEFKAKSTSGVNNINAKEIQALSIPLPPLNQQTQIVVEIEKRFSEADNLEKALDESLIKSETLRQSILKQAFEGKLV